MAIHQQGTIGLIGFNASEQTMLELFFNRRQHTPFTLTTPDRAEVLLVDLSSAMGMTKFSQFQRVRNSSLPLRGIALADEENLPEGFVSLARPLSLSGLSDALARLQKQLNAAIADEPLKVDRQTVFAEWQARKQAGKQVMDQWNQGKNLHNNGKRFFPLDRNGVQEVISKAHLVMAHRQHEIASQAQVAVNLEKNTEKASTEPLQQEPINPAVNLNASRLQDYCGHLADQDLSDPSGLRRVTFKLERSLLPWVEQAVKIGRQSQQAQQVMGLPGVLIYLPSLDSFFCDLDEDLLLHMARAKFGLDELSLMAIAPSTAVLAETSRHIPADQLLWKIALLTSRGRISEAIDLTKPLQLIRKPDFNQFEIIPHARTLAELWYSKRLSPLQLLEESRVSQRYVFTFLVAADAVGYFNP